MIRPLASLPAVTALVALGTGCFGQMDDPSTVHDLRVLAVQTEPSELFAQSCALDPAAFAAFAAPVTYRALVLDPHGQGRSIDYELRACADQTDRDCAEEAEQVVLTRGSTTPGVLELVVRPALETLDDGTPLLQRVLEEDQYQGLGGLRVPLVLRVTAGDEEVFAQKLMVYGCRLFPEMQPNVTPVLPGVQLEGLVWDEGDTKVLQGPGPFELTPVDFAALQEAYVVPSFDLKPVNLEERWRLAWYASAGTVSPNQTGGANLDGSDSRHRVEWSPPTGDEAREQDVTFWVVARDGRGGVSWISRTAHHVP